MLIGHQRIWNFLLKSAARGRLAHAYLFLGGQGLGKKTLAIEFIKSLLCENKDGCGKCPNCQKIEKNQHPDVLLVSSDQAVKIEQIRQLQHQLSLSPFCAPKKIVIIDEAEQMTLEAANCLLKTLEEPPQKSLLILVSSASQRLLPTIISRCQTIRFLPVKSEQIAEGLSRLGVKDASKIKKVVRFSCGRPGLAINLLKDDGLWAKQERLIGDLQKIQKSDLVDRFKCAQKLSQDIPSAQETMDNWLIWFRDRILESAGLKNLMVFGPAGASQNSAVKIKNILEAKRLLSESSFNQRLVLENLLIKL